MNLLEKVACTGVETNILKLKPELSTISVPIYAYVIYNWNQPFNTVLHGSQPSKETFRFLQQNEPSSPDPETDL